MEKNAGYEIRESVLFDNNRGFALGYNDRSSAPFVTWQFAEENGHRDYYWGHYHTEESAAVKDFAARSADYPPQYPGKLLAGRECVLRALRLSALPHYQRQGLSLQG